MTKGNYYDPAPTNNILVTYGALQVLYCNVYLTSYYHYYYYFFALLFLLFLSYYLVCFRCLHDEIKMYSTCCQT